MPVGSMTSPTLSRLSLTKPVSSCPILVVRTAGPTAIDRDREPAGKGWAVSVLPSGRGADVEFRILGSPEVLENGRQVPLRGSEQRALLASLLMHAHEVVSRDRLIDELWGASNEKAPSPGLFE